MKCWLEDSEPETGSTAGESGSEVMERGRDAVVDLGEEAIVTPAADEVDPALSRPEGEERFSVEEDGERSRAIVDSVARRIDSPSANRGTKIEGPPETPSTTSAET